MKTYRSMLQRLACLLLCLLMLFSFAPLGALAEGAPADVAETVEAGSELPAEDAEEVISTLELSPEDAVRIELPEQAVLSSDEPTAIAVGDGVFKKVTSTDYLQLNANYVITYTYGDKVYALTSETFSTDSRGSVQGTDVAGNIVDGVLSISNAASSPVVFYINQVNENGSYRLRNNANYDLRVRLNSTEVLGSASDISLLYNDATSLWAVKGGRSLRCNSSGVFTPDGNGANTVYELDLWTDYEPPKPAQYVKLNSLEQLANFRDKDTHFIIVLDTDGTNAGKYAMGRTGSTDTTLANWLWNVNIKTDADGNDYIEIPGGDTISANYILQVEYDDSAYNDERYPGPFQTSALNKVKSWGWSYINGETDVQEKNSDGSLKFDKNGNPVYSKTYASGGIRIIGGNYFHPQNARLSTSPLGSSRTGGNYNHTVRFEYGTDADSDKIFVRGNAEASYLGWGSYEVDTDDDGTMDDTVETYIGTLAQSDPNRVPVEIYVLVDADTAIRVEYMGTDDGTTYTTDAVTYAERGTGITLSGRAPAKGTKDGLAYDYTFVGWSTTKPATSFLSLEDSCNIFDYVYDDATETGNSQILDAILAKYDLIGDCNPDASNSFLAAAIVDQHSMTNALQLYPIYAVQGFNEPVTADEVDEEGNVTPIVGVADWKSEQGLDTYYDDAEREKWLGYIFVEIYKDGELWVKPTKVYYRYHNDNSADLSIKFIWNNRLSLPKYQDEGGKLSPLYKYMSDLEQFPAYDQSGHFFIDGVIAEQGSREDGLKYSLNWMSTCGGQLDNVVGGSTVKIYVTSKYNAKYFLDGEEITDERWVMEKGEFYTTPGTELKFAADEKSLPSSYDVYKVRLENELYGLMDRDYVREPDMEPVGEDDYDPAEWFLENETDSNADRTNKALFTYFLNPSYHNMPIADTPEELVKDGYELVSTAWTLLDQQGVDRGSLPWKGLYPITGTKYTTGNTAPAYVDEELIDPNNEANIPYTYHLYAYSLPIAPPEVPQTGDDTNVLLWAVLLAVALAAATVAVVFYLRKKNQAQHGKW